MRALLLSLLCVTGCAGTVTPWFAPMVERHREACVARGGGEGPCRGQAHDEWERWVVQYPCCAGSVSPVWVGPRGVPEITSWWGQPSGPDGPTWTPTTPQDIVWIPGAQVDLVHTP